MYTERIVAHRLSFIFSPIKVGQNSCPEYDDFRSVSGVSGTMNSAQSI